MQNDLALSHIHYNIKDVMFIPATRHIQIFSAKGNLRSFLMAS